MEELQVATLVMVIYVWPVILVFAIMAIISSWFE